MQFAQASYRRAQLIKPSCALAAAATFENCFTLALPGDAAAIKIRVLAQIICHYLSISGKRSIEPLRGSAMFSERFIVALGTRFAMLARQTPLQYPHSTFAAISVIIIASFAISIALPAQPREYNGTNKESSGLPT